MHKIVDYRFYAERGAPNDPFNRPALVFIRAPIHAVTEQERSPGRGGDFTALHYGPVGVEVAPGTVMRLPDVPA